MPHTFPDRRILHLLWGGQSCPQPPSRRLFRAVRESSEPQSPAESRLQPGFVQNRHQNQKVCGIGQECLRHRGHAVNVWLFWWRALHNDLLRDRAFAAVVVLSLAAIRAGYLDLRLPRPSAIIAVTRVLRLTPSCRARAASRE